MGAILIGLAIFGYAEVRGAGWREFGRNDEEIRYYYAQDKKLSSYWLNESSEKIVRVWMKVEYTDKGLTERVQKLGKNYENLKYTMIEEEINCTDKKWRNSSSHDYSKEGKVIYSSSRASAWKPIESGSMTETLRKALCK